MIESSISLACSGILEGGCSGWGEIAYDGFEYIVDRGIVIAEDELCHVDRTFPFTRKCNGRSEGEEEEQPDCRKHGGGRGGGERKKKRKGRGEGGSTSQVQRPAVECYEHWFSNHEDSTGGDHRERVSLVFPCKVRLQIDDQE